MTYNAGMKVFISHSEQDREAAARLASALAEQGLEVWRADVEVLPGDNWASKVSEALISSDAMVVLVSPDAMASPRVRKEIEFALGSRNYSGRLIPVVIHPTHDMPWIFKRLHTLKTAPDRIASLVPRIVRHLKQAA